MRKIVPIVEGPGDVSALPVLLGRILKKMGRYEIGVGQPKNANGIRKLLATDGLENLIRHAWSERGCAAVLILVDADDGCPLVRAKELAARAMAHGLKHPVAIVVANCEYEAWFLASLSTIVGQHWSWASHAGLDQDVIYEGDVEDKVGVKGWITANLPRPNGQRQYAYKETLDQEPLTRLIDIDLAKQNSRSFRRLCHAIEEIIDAMDNQQKIITPAP